MHEAFEHAFATLDRGARFLGAGGGQAPIAMRSRYSVPVTGPYHAKVIGNGLRELDRFLNLLIDEAAHALGRPAFPGQRNTANKLNGLYASFGLAPRDDARMRALGRSRECLFHCDGRVLRGDLRDGVRLTLGWPEVPGTDSPLRCVAIGETMVVAREDLADIAAFYRRLGSELCAVAIAGERAVNLSEPDAGTRSSR